MNQCGRSHACEGEPAVKLGSRGRARRGARTIAAGLAGLAGILALGGGLPDSAQAFDAHDDLHSYEITLPEPAAPVGAPVNDATAAAWEDFRGRHGGAWQALWDGITGSPRRLVGSGAQLVSEGMTGEAVDQISREFIRENATLFGVTVDDLTTLSVRNGAGVWFVTYQQTYRGLPVVGGRVDLRFARTGHLILASASVHPAISTVTSPGLGPSEAFSRAVADLPPDWDPVPGGETQLEILPVFGGWRYEYHLVYRLVARVEAPAAGWQTLVDAQTGQVLRRHNLVRYATLAGTSSGDVQEMTPTDPYDELGLPDQRLTVAGVGTDFTSADGSFSVEVPDTSPRDVIVRLDGRWINVDNSDGPDALITTTGVPGIDLDVKFDDANSHPAERDVFSHANLAHAYVQRLAPGLTSRDVEMRARVHRDNGGTCAAWWNWTTHTINFTREENGCANWGQIADIIYHEYGHAVTQFVYAPAGPNDAMNEGFSDFLANTITDQPLIGQGANGPGTHRRNSDNDRQWPAPECDGETHCVGEVLAGALWHMRENLIDAFGDHDAAVAHTDSLFHFARYGISTSFEDYYYDLLAVDDDNGTLLDGTPNAVGIMQAFDRHNIGPGFTLDILHAPLPDSEDSTGVFPIVAVFSSPFPPMADSLAVYYRTDGPGPFTRLPMSATGNTREYTAEIPAQPYGVTVDYYVAGAADSLETTLPDGAPVELFSFRVGVDSEAPVIAHVPLGDYAQCHWPVEVLAEVTDNLGVDEVICEFKINDVDQTPISMTRDEGTDTYRGILTGGVAVNDVVEYRIRATDAASSSNASYEPPAGFHSFNIILNLEMTAEQGEGGWTHDPVTPDYLDQWHISSQRNATGGGTFSWKFGDTGPGDYGIMADGALVTPPMTLGGDNLSMTFNHWLDAAEVNATEAWHGAVVEITTDGGATWNLIHPVGGYSHQTVDYPSSPFPDAYPCWSGFHDWREEEFLLSAYGGQTVVIRFRFGTDGFPVENEGWYVDDVTILDCLAIDVTPDIVTVATGLQGISPNPFNPSTTIHYHLAEETHVQLRIFDVEGRMVRTLMDAAQESGPYHLRWDGLTDSGSEVASGIYWVRMTTSRGFQQSAKMVTLK